MTRMDNVTEKTSTRQSQVWGARPAGEDEWDVAFWAPSATKLLLHVGGQSPVTMRRGEDGVHRARVLAIEGTRYAFSTGGSPFADPASLQQETGVEGWSILRDPASFQAEDAADPPRRAWDESAICELHIGSFTREGTFRAAAASTELRRLADVGINVIEIMPVGQFPGKRGWGYDSVLPWAPQHGYGTPEDLAALVDAAHRLGLSVYVDLVFNHFGPKGSMLGEVCPEFFLDECNDWGQKIDFSRPEVRAYFIGCALHWLRAYDLDGLRFDAVHAIEDDSDPHLVVEMAQTIRQTDFGRPIHLVAEDSSNRVGWYDPAAGLFDASWDDDYHHALHVLLTGESFGYYKDFTRDPHADLRLALRDGQTLQGQSRPVGEEKGEPSGHLPPRCFVNFNLNHDHAGNRPKGERLISLIGADRALVAHAFLLAAPYIPLIFMGEEIGSRRPFPWFADYGGKTAKKMREGRAEQFKDLPGKGQDMLDPFDPETMRMAWPYASPEPRDTDLWLKVTKEVLALRRDRLVPMFRSGRSGEFEITRLGDRGLCALWHFKAGTLQADLAFDPGDPDPEVPQGFQSLYELGQAGAPRFRLGLLVA